jgi:hypothetical protein
MKQERNNMKRNSIMKIILGIAILIPFILGNINCKGDVFKTLIDDGGGDRTPPDVISVMSTAMDKVRVEFSEDVDGVSATETTNYTILGLNVIDAEISANPKVVVLTTDVQLNETYYIAIDNVEDMSGNSMALCNKEFLGAENEPRILSVTAIKVNQIRIMFSEDVDVGSATYTINPSLTYTSTGSAIYSNPYVTITLDTGVEMQSTNYTVEVDGVQDLEGYALHPRYSSMSFAGDARPRIAMINSTSTTSIRIQFTEDVEEFSAEDINNYQIIGVISGSITLTGCTATRDSLNHTIVGIDHTLGGNQSNESYQVIVNNIKDSNENTVKTNTTGYFFGDGPPTIASAYASGPNKVIVTFSEPIKDDDRTAAGTASNYSIEGLTISAALVQGTVGNPFTVVELTTSTQLQQIYTVSLTTGILHAVDNNATINSGYNMASFQGDGIPIITNAIALSNTQIKVIFSEPVDKDTAETTTNYSITAGGFPSLSITNAERGSDPNTNEVTLTVSGQLYVSYTVAVSNVEDLTGNTISGNNTAMFAGIGTDNTPPSLISVNANSSTLLRVYFNEPVDQTTSETENNYFISNYASAIITVSGTPTVDQTLIITVANSITGTDQITLTSRAAEDASNWEFRYDNSETEKTELIAYSITNVINSHSDSPVRAYNKDNTVVLVSKTFGGSSNTGKITITNNLGGNVTIDTTYATPTYNQLGGSDTATRSPGNYSQVDLTLAAGLSAGIYQLEVQNVEDTILPGNPIVSAKATFIVKSTGDTTPPELAGVYAVDENHIKLLFNEPVTEISASNKDNFAIEREIAQFTVDSAAIDPDYLTISYNDGSPTSYTIYAKSANDFASNEFEGGNPVSKTVLNITKCLNFSPNSPVRAHAEGATIYISLRTAGSGTISSIAASGFSISGVSITSADYSNNQTIVSSSLNNDFPREVILTLSTDLVADSPTNEYVITSTGVGDLNEDTNYNYGGKQISLYLWSGNSTPSGDTEAPYIVYVEAISDTMIRVVFNEEVNAADAATPSYYSLDNNLQLDSTRNPYRDSNFTNTVIVYTTSMSALTYTLTVTNIRDTSSSQNAIVSDSKSYTGLAAVTVDTGPVGNTIYGIGNVKNLAITSMVVYDYNDSDPSNDVIFIGTQNQSANLGKNSEVYVSENTGVYFSLAATPGFGEEDQEIVSSFAVKGSTIYASTKPSAGIDLQVYSVDNPTGSTPYVWSQVTSDSTNNVYTYLAYFGVTTKRMYWTFSNKILCETDWGTYLQEFNDAIVNVNTTRAIVGYGGRLYIAGSNIASKMVVIRSKGTYAGDPASGDEWEKVLDAASGLGMNGHNGASDANNSSAISLVAFKGYIYVSSVNTTSGAQVWRSQDGLTWDKVRDFGDSSLSAPYYDTNNTQISSMCVNGNYLYLGTKNATDGAEAWRSPDGVSWNQFGSNGFGSDDYTEITSMVSYRNLIYFGMASSVGGAIFRSSN